MTSEAIPLILPQPEVNLYLTTKINKFDLTHCIKSETQVHINNKYTGYLHIFTDGSKCPYTGKVASASVIPSNGVKLIDRLTDKTSIYTAEMLAIRSALSWVIENKPKNALFRLHVLTGLYTIKQKL